MLASDFAEANASTMHIEDCTKFIFKIFLVFLYTGQIDKHPVKDLMDVLKVANKYGVESLKTSCDDLILCKLKSTDPVHEVYQYAHACQCSQELKEKAFELVKQ
jgi:BTB/POZ domain